MILLTVVLMRLLALLLVALAACPIQVLAIFSGSGSDSWLSALSAPTQSETPLAVPNVPPVPPRAATAQPSIGAGALFHPAPGTPPLDLAFRDVNISSQTQLVMSLLRPDLQELVMRDTGLSADSELFPAMDKAIDWADRQLQHDRVVGVRVQGWHGRHAATGLVGEAVQPIGRVTGPESALQALAEYADRRQPALIVLMIDQLLQLPAPRCCSADAVWVVGVVANALGVLAAMRGHPQASVVYMQAVLRKAARRGVPMGALALKLFSSNLLLPLLRMPPPLDVAARSCPVWRAQLANVAVLNHWHGHDAVLAYAAAAADAQAANLWRLPGSGCCTPLRRVSGVVLDALHWWRQPEARGVLTSHSEGDLWTAFAPQLAAVGDVLPPAVAELMASARVARPLPLHVAAADVVPAALSFRTVLAAAGCLSGDPARLTPRWTDALLPTPGCAGLRAFLRTPAGVDAHMRPFAVYSGALGSIMRALGRAGLLLRALRDDAMLATAVAMGVARRHVRSMLQPAPPTARMPVPPQTLYEWFAATDPWTVLGTSVAAVLAVLRVIVRLSSAFTTAATLSTPAEAPATLSAAPAPAAPVPEMPAQVPAAPALARRAKKSGKGRSKSQRSKAAASPRVAAAPQSPLLRPPSAGRSAPPSAPVHLGPTPADSAALLGSAATAAHRPGTIASPAAVAELRVAAAPSALAVSHPALAEAVRASLPQVVRPPALPRLQRGAEQPRMLGRHAAALAQLHLMHQLSRTKGLKAGTAPQPFSLPCPDDFIADADAEIMHGGALPASTPPAAETIVVPIADGPTAAELGVQPIAAGPGAAPATLGAVGGRGCPAMRLFRKEEAGEVPELFLCPISRELMDNPVLASDGHIYERPQIEAWLRHHSTSPMTNMHMATELAPVIALRSEIQDFKARFPHLL